MTTKSAVVLTLLLLSTPIALLSQSADGASAAKGLSPEIRAQYEFLIGDWDVAVTLHGPGTEDVSYHAQWRNHWLADGQVVLQEWHGPDGKGLELRTYSAQQKMWIGRNVYLPDPGQWYDNTAQWMDGEMVVTTHRKDPRGQAVISQEIYHDISPRHFSIRTQASRDGGKTWKPGGYEARMTRLTK